MWSFLVGKIVVLNYVSIIIIMFVHIKLCNILNQLLIIISMNSLGCTTLNKTKGATSGAGVAYPSRAPELNLVFVGFMLLQL